MTRFFARTGLLLLVAATVACGGGTNDTPSAESAGEPAAEPAESAPESAGIPTSLVGRYQLIEIQSMDDAQGVTRIEDPSKFTMTLNADSTVNMQLDCNRGNGSWSASPSADGNSGSFSFGPLATTKALCPPPNLDEKIASNAQYIAGYLFRDGQLNLTLMADGGIWVWEPLPAGAP